jgi:outer membrane protein assembly factor BamB
VAWSEGENVRWKILLPGKGLSTPIISGERVFVTTAVPHGEAAAPTAADAPGAHDNLPPLRRQKFVVLAIDRRSGEIIWQRAVRDARPHEGAHITGSWASASPVTDGERLFASFGSQGIYALDFDGKLLWQKDLGDMRIFHGHGEGSSPALHGETLVVNWDHQGESFVVALDKRTGSERWRVARDEITSWSTPLIVEHSGRVQVIVSATRRTRSYDLADGHLLWQVGGLSRNVVASPVAGDGLVYVTSSYDTRAMLAIRLDAARGDVTAAEAVVWTLGRDTPYVSSPILYDGSLCFLKHLQNVLTCVDARSGGILHGPRRIPGSQGVFASPVGAAGRIYVTSRDGTTAVLQHGGLFALLATNTLDDSFAASPAIAGDALFLRGERHLYCLARPSATAGRP